MIERFVRLVDGGGYQCVHFMLLFLYVMSFAPISRLYPVTQKDFSKDSGGHDHLS